VHFNMMAGEGLRLVAVGTVAGLAAALMAGRVTQSFLYGVATTDLVSFGGSRSLSLR
jgi:hypothetical protein